MKNPFDLVLIEWIDSYAAPSSWEYLEGLDPLVPEKCLTVGFLLEDTKNYKCLGQSITRKQVVGRMSIPVGCIQRTTILHHRDKS